nr:hypothetical protein [uncultured Arsenicibacter sp.]
MGERYLIDTNALLEFLGRTLPPDAHHFLSGVINEQFNISVINRIEVLGHESATETLVEFMNLANTYAIEKDIEEQTIALRKQKK